MSARADAETRRSWGEGEAFVMLFLYEVGAERRHPISRREPAGREYWRFKRAVPGLSGFCAMVAGAGFCNQAMFPPRWLAAEIHCSFSFGSSGSRISRRGCSCGLCVVSDAMASLHIAGKVESDRAPSPRPAVNDRVRGAMDAYSGFAPTGLCVG